MRSAAWLASFSLFALTEVALAQPPAGGAQLRLRGTIEAFDGQTLRMQTLADGPVEFAVAATTGINGVARRTLADIGDNAFIGTTAAKDADGRWRATEVHIFPEEMRGAGEGHYAWDFPETTMTNAAVTGMAAVGDGRALTLTHGGGVVEVVVDSSTEIVALTLGSPSLLVAGARIFVLGQVDVVGTFNAIAIVAEQNGVEPPM